jgi:hypothetical protein
LEEDNARCHNLAEPYSRIKKHRTVNIQEFSHSGAHTYAFTLLAVPIGSTVHIFLHTYVDVTSIFTISVKIFVPVLPLKLPHLEVQNADRSTSRGTLAF